MSDNEYTIEEDIADLVDGYAYGTQGDGSMVDIDVANRQATADAERIVKRIKAEARVAAMREAADHIDQTLKDAGVLEPEEAALESAWLRDLADREAKEAGL